MATGVLDRCPADMVIAITGVYAALELADEMLEEMGSSRSGKGERT
jgi:hypothetical protein